MSTVIISIVSVILLIGVVYLIQAIRKHVATNQLSEMLDDYYFESSDRRVTFQIKKQVLQFIKVGEQDKEKDYDSFEELLACESFTKNDHGIIQAVHMVMERNRRIINQDIVNPKSYREFKDTPIGDLRIYNEGSVRISPRMIIVLGKNGEGKMEIGRAFIAKKDLVADSFRRDFKLIPTNKGKQVTETEALEDNAGFKEYFLSKTKEYRKEIADYNEIRAALELYNDHRNDFTMERGKLVFGGRITQTKQKALPEPITSRTIDPERDEVDRLIRTAREHR